MSQSVTFGKRLKESRTACGYSQQYVAERLNVSRAAYSYYENDSREMRQTDVAIVCKLLRVSADYLLGLSNTKQPEYAKIAETTGLNQDSIQRLKQAMNFQSEMINHLLSEEPDFSLSIDPAFEAYLNSPEQVEAAYQNHLRGLAWEAEMKKTPILEHLAKEWAHNDHESSMTEAQLIAREEEYAKNHVCKYIDMDHVDPGSLPMTVADAVRQENEMLQREQAETRKSNLLSAITEYVRYTSGCTIETMGGTEQLTHLHTLRIGTGTGQSITFPSKEADELMDFMLLQKVIHALKTFKQNCFSKTK